VTARARLELKVLAVIVLSWLCLLSGMIWEGGPFR